MLSISSRSPSSRIDYIKLVTRLMRCEFSEAQTTLTDTLIVFLFQPLLNSSTSVDNSRSGNFHLSKTMRILVNNSDLFIFILFIIIDKYTLMYIPICITNRLFLHISYKLNCWTYVGGVVLNIRFELTQKKI